MIQEVNQYTHAADATKVEVAKIRTNMNRKAEATLDAPHRIPPDALANASHAAAVNLPHIEHARRTMRRQREGDDAEPVIPQNRDGISVVPHEFGTTSNGNRFLISYMIAESVIKIG